MSTVKISTLAVLLMFASGQLLAAAVSPAGTWRSIDDKTKQERSIIRITEENGELKGVVEKIFDEPGDDPAHLCKECKDERKDKPIVGMTIIWEIRQDAEEPNLFTGGQILDPAKGSSYKLRLKPIEGGKKLEVRGYIGSPMFGRTQTWVRVE